MENMVENINIEDIISINNEENFNQEEINNLKESINNYGIIEPLIVRKNNDKYEILAGKKRYHAAKLLGLNKVPVLIKNIDTNFYKPTKEPIHQSMGNKFINPLPNAEKNQEKQNVKKNDITSNSINNNIENESIAFNMSTFERNENDDIVNLSELNKEEIERDDLKMNNEMLNNQMVQPENTNTIQEPQAPSFGGRFFPSLEDEPTNMNIGGMNFVGEQATNPLPPTPVSPTQQNSNLIDLTDINTEGNIAPIQNNPLPQQFNQPTPPTMNNTNVEPTISQMDNQSQMEPTAPILDPMSNSLPQNEFAGTETNSQSIVQQPMMEEVPTLNLPSDDTISTINNNISEPSQPIPQFDMSQSVPPMDSGQNQYNSEPNNNPQLGIPNIQESIPTYNEMEQPLPQMEQPMPMQNQPMENPNMNPIQPLVQETNEKDITSVTNTFKSLVESLKVVGYAINISEEQLPTSTKLTIEIQK